jgi:hypothetical protein
MIEQFPIPTAEPEQLDRLYSGMELPDSAERTLLEEKLKDAYYEGYGGGPVQMANADRIANSVAEVAGIEMVREGDYERDYDNNRCGHFAFGEQKGEQWAAPGVELPHEIWLETIPFLRERGYQIVDKPTAGDIAAYTHAPPDFIKEDRGKFYHFGVVEPDGRILSKFTQGPVVKHPVDTVPVSYGRAVYFMRKSDPVQSYES